LSLDALAPCRQQSLKVGETANIFARPDIVKEAAPDPIARCPLPRQKILEIQRRTWLDRGTLPVRQIVQCDPFGDGSAPNASFGGDVPEGPPGRMHPFGVDEQSLTGKTALTARGLVAVARDSRKPGSTGAPTDGCHFPLDVLTQVLHQMEAIGDLLGGWRAFPDAFGIEPTTVTADDFGPGMLI
jgi:hypothetical protein